MRASIYPVCVALSVSACSSWPGASSQPNVSAVTDSVRQPATPVAQVEPFRQQPRNIPAPASPFQLSRQTLPNSMPTMQPHLHGLVSARSALPTPSDLLCVNAMRTYKASLGADEFGQPSILRDAMVETCSDKPALAPAPPTTQLPLRSPSSVESVPNVIGVGVSLY